MKTKSRIFLPMRFFVLGILFVFLNNTMAQEINVTGTVTDSETGTPLPGVTVLLEGTQKGSLTNMDGVYEIAVPSKAAILTFSYVGYTTKSLDVAGSNIIDVQLEPELTELDEVVVVGYGTMRKKDLTGSVTAIKTSDIQANKSTNALQTLQGKVAGLDLSQRDGQAGAGIKLTMRGLRSLSAGNDPLILVDGVEYGQTLDINTLDIESIDVLKDVASTAIYGTKGANGVILITTKRGGGGKTNISYSNYFSYNQPTYIPHIMNGQEYQQKQYEVVIAAEEYALWDDQNVHYNRRTGEVTWDETANPEPWSVFGTVTLEDLVIQEGVADKYELITDDPTALELLRNNVSLDYLDMIMVNSWSQNHEISINGGNDKSAYNLSVGLLDDNGLLRRDEMRRYNFTVGGDHEISKSIKVGANVIYTNKKYSRRDGGIFNTALKCGPIGSLYNEDGSYRDIPDPVLAYNHINPMLDEVEGAQIDDIFVNRVFSSAYFDWQIIEGLSFRTNLGVNIELTKEGKFNSARSLQQFANQTPKAELKYDDTRSYTWNNIINYKKTIGIHSIHLMAGSETYELEFTRGQMIGYNQPVESTSYYDFKGIPQGQSTVSSEYSKKQMLSFFGRTNYSLMDRYLLQATLRYDGASVLYPGNKWSSFPSVSAGWRISEEDFLKGIQAVSNLKIRYSWGIAGNAAVPAYSSKTQLDNRLSYMTFGNEVYSQYLPLRIGSKGLTWERTASHNLGVDLGLFKNRVNGSIDYYNSRTYDLLFKVPLPLVYVYTDTWANVASTRNKGIEIALGGVIIDTKAMDWSMDVNFSRNKGEVVDLREGSTQLVYDDDKIWQVGSPVDAFYVYENDGVYQIEDLQAELEYVSQQNATGDSIERGRIPMLSNNFEPGDIKLVDQNGDGELTDEDRIILDASPSFLYGIGTNLHLKTSAGVFGIRVYAIGRWGQTIDYDFYSRIKDARDKTNGPYVEAWTPQNTDAVFPRNSEEGNNTSAIHRSSLRFIDGSYVKIKDITFSYALPKAWLNTVKIENMEVYATAKNMFSFSKIENYDPEEAGNFGFPMQKNLIFGVNINF
ncbi:MAG: TonB-dependent receptor [Bacteroidales bacterium]|nr:TonB-dependent receptor [Bacteroidales bacterium]